MQGPPGANLFVFRIPDDFTDESMKDTFAPFGNLLDPLALRVRVMVTLAHKYPRDCITKRFLLLIQKPTCTYQVTWGTWAMAGMPYHQALVFM